MLMWILPPIRPFSHNSWESQLAVLLTGHIQATTFHVSAVYFGTIFNHTMINNLGFHAITGCRPVKSYCLSEQYFCLTTKGADIIYSLGSISGKEWSQEKIVSPCLLFSVGIFHLPQTAVWLLRLTSAIWDHRSHTYHKDKRTILHQASTGPKSLTHWGRVTHICVGNLTIIGSDNGLSPGQRQAIIWTYAGILLIGPLGTNFSEMLIEIHAFSLKNIHLKMLSGKWRPFCLGLYVLTYVMLNFPITEMAQVPENLPCGE